MASLGGNYRGVPFYFDDRADFDRDLEGDAQPGLRGLDYLGRNIFALAAAAERNEGGLIHAETQFGSPVFHGLNIGREQEYL